MNLFERWLTLWVALCIVTGIALGQWLPGVFQTIGALEVARVNLPVGLLILLAAAPCTAMVFVWSRLTNGDPLFTLSQVALNDSIMVVAFAPLVGLLLGMSATVVPWSPRWCCTS